jgi:hypothetical protein
MTGSTNGTGHATASTCPSTTQQRPAVGRSPVVSGGHGWVPDWACVPHDIDAHDPAVEAARERSRARVIAAPNCTESDRPDRPGESDLACQASLLGAAGVDSGVIHCGGWGSAQASIMAVSPHT